MFLYFVVTSLIIGIYCERSATSYSNQGTDDQSETFNLLDCNNPFQKGCDFLVNATFFARNPDIGDLENANRFVSQLPLPQRVPKPQLREFVPQSLRNYIYEFDQINPFTNEPNSESKFVLKQHNACGAREEVLHLDSETAKTNGVRLVTNYFNSNNYMWACLRVDYYKSGLGADVLWILQQDERDRLVFYSVTNACKTALIDIDMRGRNPRFFIEAKIRPGVKGEIGLRRVEFSYGACRTCQQIENQLLEKGIRVADCRNY